MVHAAYLIAAAVLGVGAATPPPQPLEVVVVDEASFPAVTFDVVVPTPLSATELDASMLTVNGAPVESLTSIDPTRTAVAVVIDDRPVASDQAVGDAQAAAVDLVRNLGTGSGLALYTPSGLQTALTADRDAAIARIAGIVSGAPDVVPLPDVLVAAATDLGNAAQPDRHLVVALGAELTLDETQGTALTDAVEAGGARVHVVSPMPVPAVLSDLVAATGGRAPTTEYLAGIDQITNGIVVRYRAVTRVDGASPHEVALQVDGARYTATIDVAEPAAPTVPAAPAPPPSPTDAASTSTAATTSPPATSAAPVTTGEPAGADPTPTTTVAPASPSEGRPAALLIVIAIVALVAVAASAVAAAWYRRTRRRVAPPPVPARHAEPAPQPEPEPKLATAVGPAPAHAMAPAAAATAMASTTHNGDPSTAEPPAAEPIAAPELRVDPEAPTIPDQPTRPAVPPARASRPVDRRQPSKGAPRGRVLRAPRDPGDDLVPATPSGDSPAPGGAAQPDTTDWLVAGPVQMSVATGEVWRGRRKVQLTDPQRSVLRLLLTEGRNGLTAASILQAAGRSPDEGKRAADNLIAQVKRRVGMPTVGGRGVRTERTYLYYLDESD